jgi:uncharacterized repeat protein (TIGR01451 family)
MAGSSSSSYRARLATRLAKRCGRLVCAVSVLVGVVGGGTAPSIATAAITCQTSWLATAGGQWSDAANWSAGVPTSGTNACITKFGTYTVHLTGGQDAAALIVGGSNGAQTLSIEGTCESGAAELHLGAGSMVNPHGTVALTDTGDCQYAWLDQMAGTLTNKGTIVSADSGTAQYRFIYGDFVNTGTVTIDATLTSDDGGHTHTNTGTVSIASGAAWDDNDSFRNLGGSLTTTGTGAFNQANATFTQGNGLTSGVVVHHGNIAYTGPGSSAIVATGSNNLSGNIAAGQSLTAEGGCGSGPGYLAVASPWTNAGTITLTDTGDCHWVWLDQVSGTFTNTGTVHIANSGTTQARYIYGDLANSGTITIDATLTSDDSGRTHTNTGTVSIASGAAWDEEDAFWNLGGSLTTTGTGSFNQVFGTFVQGDGTTNGTVVAEGSGLKYTGTGASTIVAHGIVNLSGDIGAAQNLTAEGTCASGNALLASGSPLTNAGTISLTDVGGCSAAGFAQTAGTLTNTGTIHVASPGSAQARSLIGSVENWGTLVIDARANLQTTGGTITNETTGTIETHLASNTHYGHLSSSDTVQLGGALTIVRDGTYSPALGREFTIVTCASCLGAFATVAGQSVTPPTALAIASTPTTVTLTVAKAADLSIIGSAPSPVAAGSPFTYTFVVHNAGPRPAAAVSLFDTLPAGVTFSSASPGCSPGTGTVTCALGTVFLGKSVTITITVTAGAPGFVTDRASVTATSVDLTPGDASCKVRVRVT